jgi:hypothetical protein
MHTIHIMGMEAKISQKGKPFFKVSDAEGATLFAWGKNDSELIVKLREAMESSTPINVIITKSGDYSTIKAVA